MPLLTNITSAREQASKIFLCMAFTLTLYDCKSLCLLTLLVQESRRLNILVAWSLHSHITAAKADKRAGIQISRVAAVKELASRRDTLDKHPCCGVVTPPRQVAFSRELFCSLRYSLAYLCVPGASGLGRQLLMIRTEKVPAFSIIIYAIIHYFL
jgi:hypothetical protein